MTDGIINLTPDRASRLSATALDLDRMIWGSFFWGSFFRQLNGFERKPEDLLKSWVKALRNSVFNRGKFYLTPYHVCITMIVNPSLQAQPRHQVSSMIVPSADASIYNWIEQTGRFIQGDEADFSWSQDDDDLLEPLLLATADEDDE